MTAQMTSNKKKSRRPEMRFETRQGAVFKRNNYITYTETNKTYTINLPFNLETAKFYPLNINRKTEISSEFCEINNTHCSHVIDFRNKSLKERIDNILLIECKASNPKYNIKDYTSKKDDIKYKTYDDICWVVGVGGWKKSLVRKATNNLAMEDKTLCPMVAVVVETPARIIKSVIDEIVDDVLVGVEHNECKEKIIASINVINNKDTVKTRLEKRICNFQNNIDGMTGIEPISEEQQNNSEYIKHLTYSSYDEFSHIFRPNIVVNN